MCGICGFCGIGDASAFANHEMITKNIHGMTDSLAHRGPDDKGCWIDAQRRIALGHRRLSIMDLSARGRQPMLSSSGRFVITFNGEIYNYPLLMKELQSKGTVFKSNCDTEVLVEAIDCYGIEEAIAKTEGMFALAVYDRKENCIYLARDRMGEKPVYYGWNNGTFVFASELRALKALPFFRPEIEERAVYLFLKYRFIRSPLSIYKGIHKLPSGSIHALDLRTRAEATRKYWSLEDVAREGVDKRREGMTLDDATDRLDECLTGVISRQMRSDVPLGLFLSSGIDSSVIAALSQKQSLKSINTFTIGVSDGKLNEADAAHKIAGHLKTNHRELCITEQDAAESFSEMVHVYDEPYANPSQIPTYFVSKLSRKHVSVCLAGDGGDELFAGYRRMRTRAQWWEKKTSHALKFSDFYEFYLYSVFEQDFFTNKITKVPPLEKEYFTQFTTKLLSDSFDMAMHFESLFFLEGDSCVRGDRASMAHGLEVRMPFLSHKAVEFAGRFP